MPVRDGVVIEDEEPIAAAIGQAWNVVTEAADANTLLEDLTAELEALASSSISSVETTLLIHPSVLGKFLDYNDFLGVAERLVGELGLRGIIQIASFHPDYQFAGTEADGVETDWRSATYPVRGRLRPLSRGAACQVPGGSREGSCGLTDGDLTRGYYIAGTGTINADGTVGAVGGAAEKAIAILRDTKKPSVELGTVRNEVLALQKENRELRKEFDELKKKLEATPASLTTKTNKNLKPVKR